MMEYLEYLGPIAIILICWLFANSMLTDNKIKQLEKRIQDLEKALSER